jgi:hypothetical protein
MERKRKDFSLNLSRNVSYPRNRTKINIKRSEAISVFHPRFYNTYFVNELRKLWRSWTNLAQFY